MSVPVMQVFSLRMSIKEKMECQHYSVPGNPTQEHTQQYIIAVKDAS